MIDTFLSCFRVLNLCFIETCRLFLIGLYQYVCCQVIFERVEHYVRWDEYI